MVRLTITSIQALDDYPIEVAHHEPSHQSHGNRVVVINSGAGIPRGYYEAFASWLADEGFHVVTYDYRGVGGSRGTSIKGLPASIRDWGSKDCAAALAYAEKAAPGAKVYVLGHSIGGLVTGFVSDGPEIERMLLVSPHTGFLGDYARLSRGRMLLYWHVFMPLVTQLVGYFPGRMLGLPEDLPYEVAIEWGRRRFRRDLTGDSEHGHFAHITTRALVLRPDDDPFATSAATERIRSKLPNTDFIELIIPASASPSRRIGHFGFFRARCRSSLWPLVLQWFISA